MNEWKNIQLHDLISFSIPGEWGGNPKADNDPFVIRAADFTKDCKLRKEVGVRRRIPSVKLNNRVLKNNDLLIEKSGGSPDQPVGRVVLFDIENEHQVYTFSNFLQLLRTQADYDSKYIYYLFYFNYFEGNVTRYQQQTTGIYNLKLDDYLSERVTIPSNKSHQKKIATILSTIDRAIENTEALIEKYQQIKTGLMHDLFTRGIGENGKLRPARSEVPELYKKTEIGWIPKDWEVCALNQMVSFIRSGLSRLLSEDDIGIPVIISGNIQDFEMDYSHLRYWYRLDPQGANVEDYILKEEDILLCFINSLDQIGKVALFKGFARPCIYTTNLFRIRASFNVTPTFLYFLLATPFIQKELKLISKPAVNQASFTTKDFLKIKVPHINPSEQLKICKMLLSISDYITKENSALSKLQMQKNGLMHDLLTGKVEVSV
ncbi:MAG: hypothetical protein GX639_19085 [Fibrobacter sp.]|nr:hypothetical protein [Fibrobacter sp.]